MTLDVENMAFALKMIHTVMNQTMISIFLNVAITLEWYMRMILMEKKNIYLLIDVVQTASNLLKNILLKKRNMQKIKEGLSKN